MFRPALNFLTMSQTFLRREVDLVDIAILTSHWLEERK
jgi:hypothetical protein